MDSEPIQAARPRIDDKRNLFIAGILLFVMSGGLLAYIALRPATSAPQAAAATPAAIDSYKDITVSAKAAVVYDLTTGKMLYGKNEHSQLPLASITKLLSIYAAVDSLSPQTPVTITNKALSMDGDSGLKEGEQFTFASLARFSLVASSNDGTEAIAEASASRRAISGIELLAQAAVAAGLEQTYAINGTGLDENTETAGAYGSALDIARLAGKLLEKAPDIAHATIEPDISIRSLSGSEIHADNTNPDVIKTPGLLLSKTGFTDLAGGNLVIVFDAGVNHPVAITVLGSTREERFTDTMKLLDATTAHFANIPSSSL